MSDKGPTSPTGRTTRRKVHQYSSDQITVLYEPEACIHAAECVRGLPVVFDASKRRWIAPEKGEPETIKDVISRCPSGALSYREEETTVMNDTTQTAETTTATEVTCLPNGPIRLTGNIEIHLPDGTTEKVRKAIAWMHTGGKLGEKQDDDLMTEVAIATQATDMDQRRLGMTGWCEAQKTNLAGLIRSKGG